MIERSFPDNFLSISNLKLEEAGYFLQSFYTFGESRVIYQSSFKILHNTPTPTSRFQLGIETLFYSGPVAKVSIAEEGNQETSYHTKLSVCLPFPLPNLRIIILIMPKHFYFPTLRPPKVRELVKEVFQRKKLAT